MNDNQHVVTPYLIRGSKGIPVGVVPHVPTTHSGSIHQQPLASNSQLEPHQQRIFYSHGTSRSKKSSVVKAIAVRKTATTKKKKVLGANNIDECVLDRSTLQVDGNIWRPLGTFMENPAELSVIHQPLMNPPRLSEEVRPMNLQGLFDTMNSHERKTTIPPKLQVFVRIRPCQGTGGGMACNNDNSCMYVTSSGGLGVSPPLGSLAYKHGDCQMGQTFSFTKVFGPSVSQMDYYVATAKSMVENLLQPDQGEGVFLSYGITNAGKTFTTQGTKENPGIIPLALKSLFLESDITDHSVDVSFCEIYNESIFDLLLEGNGVSLKLVDGKDGMIHVAGLTWHKIESTQDAWRTLQVGIKQRRRAGTKLNYSSSRSHSVFTIRLQRSNGKRNQISFVDLAGSERVGRTGNCGARFKEAVSINSSLMTLGRCLEYLKYNQEAMKTKIPLKVIPYRESKVTHLFRDVLHGHGHIVLSVNISSSPNDFDETLRVLKYAIVASKISSSFPVYTKRKLRAETPIGLRRHRLRMEQKKDTVSGKKSSSESGAGATVVHHIGDNQTVSIDSKILENSQGSPLPQVLKEDEINGSILASIQEDKSISFARLTDCDDRSSSETSEQSPVSTNSVESADNRVEIRCRGSLQKKVEQLQKQLQSAEKRLVGMETEIREEVATEMTQIVNNIEANYKQRLEDQSNLAKEKIKALEKDHKEEIENIVSKLASQETILDNLRLTFDKVKREETQTHEKFVESKEEAERYKKALNDALSEIERLHVVIEQEELANARLAASLSEVLKDQSSSVNICSMTPEADIKLKFKRFKEEVTQIEANNAMEQEMSEHLIERLRKDNEMLKTKISAMMHAIDISSPPSKNVIIENLVTFCPPGTGRGAGGTPHDVALARARRDCNEENEKSPKVSRFAREVLLTQEENECPEEDEEHDMDILTPNSTCAVVQDDNPNFKTGSDPRPRRSSPRKKKEKDNMTKGERIPDDSPPVLKGNGWGEDSKFSCVPEGQVNHPKSKRKLLSKSKSKPSKSGKGSMKILAVSNVERKTRRGMPSASELGLTPA